MARVGASGVLVAVFAVVATGCGGGSSDKHEFADKADQICADVSKRVAQLNQASPRSVPELTKFIEQLKKTEKDGIARLQALKLPEGRAGTTAKDFTDTLEREFDQQVLPALNQVERAVRKKDKHALKAASKRLQQAQKQKRSTLLAAQLGASQCAAGA
jgi:Tfp pilus assembly protein PilP